jgi:hypothetical protein
MHLFRCVNACKPGNAVHGLDRRVKPLVGVAFPELAFEPVAIRMPLARALETHGLNGPQRGQHLTLDLLIVADAKPDQVRCLRGVIFDGLIRDAPFCCQGVYGRRAEKLAPRHQVTDF